MGKTNKGLRDLRRRNLLRNIACVSGVLLFFGFLTWFFTWDTPGHVWVLGMIEVLVAIGTFVAGIFLANRRKRYLINQLENFCLGVEESTRAAVLNFPEALVVTNHEGMVQWYNRRFQKMVGREVMFDEYIQDLLPDFQFSRFAEQTCVISEEYSHDNHPYLVTGQTISVNRTGEKLGMMGLYFTDLTREKMMLQKMADKKIVVCAALIDNYDEVFKGTPNNSHGALIGEIERCVSNWVSQGGGISVRYERDKFLILFEAAKFEPLWKEKFTILDQVKEIEQGNQIPVTISIGVGQNKDTIAENEDLARTALDMALGRGGDQVVVKTEVGFHFFGAKSREIEKSTKVKSRVVAHSLRDLAERASRVFLMGHRNADADSLGAAVGLFRMMRAQKVEAYIALNREHNNVQPILQKLRQESEYNERILGEERVLDLLDEESLLIVVDTHRPSMVEFPAVLRNCKNVVLIDHHRRSEEFIEDTVLSYHEPYVSSSSEMVTEILQYVEIGQSLSSLEAEALYSGIYLDTKGFTFKTGARTFEAASYLRKRGVDPVNMRRIFCNDMGSYIQKANIISGAQIYRSNIAIAMCTEKYADTQLMVAQAADDLLNIRGIEAAFVLATEGNRIIISGRSLGTINVQVILEKLGGGGHITIAGAQIASESLDMAKAKLQEAIDEIVG